MSAELQPLREMSARIGGDTALIQGAGGNTSVKLGGSLWVKASGCQLSDAVRRPIFVELSLDVVRAELATRAPDERFLSATVTCSDSPLLRPSIETALHAVLPHPVVVHAHSVNCTTASMLVRGRQRISDVCSGSWRWAWISYCRPGLPLACAVRNAWDQCRADVYILQNHGVVIGAADCDSAERILKELERRLDFPRLPPSGGGGNSTAPPATHYDAPPAGAACDERSIGFLTEAARFPDQVVFLGGAVPRVLDCTSADRCAYEAMQRRADPPAYVFVDGVGLLAARRRTSAADTVMDALLALACRIPAGEPVTGLTRDQVAELLDWEAEQHRRSMSR